MKTAITIALALCAVWTQTPGTTPSEWRKTMQPAADSMSEALTVRLEAERTYLIGFPIIVMVTFSNRSRVPLTVYELSLVLPSGPITVDLQPVRGGTALSTKLPYRSEGVIELTLEPGEEKRMPWDLSNLGLSIRPGAYEMRVALHKSNSVIVSPPAYVEFNQPNLVDSAEAARLRAMGGAPTDTGAWAPFLKNNWRTVTVSPQLSAEARRHLTLHLFAHRAFYGPDPIGMLDPSPLRTLDGPVLGAEASMFAAEVFHAKGDFINAGSVGRALAKEFPAMHFRLARLDEGQGFLARGRKLHGIESEPVDQAPGRPYVE